MQAALKKLLDTQSFSQPKVLLVEDSLPDTVLIKRLIESYYPLTLIDHAVLKAEAHAFLQKNRYDIVFLDLNLPDSIGISDVEEIKAAAGDTPVIVVTGYYEHAVANDIKSYRVNGIIGKNHLVHKEFPAVIMDAASNIETL